MKRFFALFFFLGLLYLLIETIFTAIMSGSISLIGHTSLWMVLVGGSLGIVLGLFNERGWFQNKLNTFFQSLIGICLIFFIEFLTGCILNLAFKLNIWDYSGLPLNVAGQITFCFAPLWFLICPLAFWADDQMRTYMHMGGFKKQLCQYYIDLFKGV